VQAFAAAAVVVVVPEIEEPAWDVVESEPRLPAQKRGRRMHAGRASRPSQWSQSLPN